MNWKRKIFRIFKVLTTLLLLLIITIVIYVLNVYKTKISEKQIAHLVEKINSSPNYPSKIYPILGNIDSELDTTITEFDCWINNNIHSSPSRKTAWINALSGIHTVSFAFKLDRTIKPKKMVDYLLTNIPFGYNQRGLDSAARFFLNKSVDSLRDRELISLAAMIKANTLFNPIRNPEKNAARTEHLIELLKNRGIKLDSSCD